MPWERRPFPAHPGVGNREYQGSGSKLRTSYGPRRPNSAHLNGQLWTSAISGSRSRTVEARSGGQGVASSNLASPTKPIHPIRPSRTCIQPAFLPALDNTDGRPVRTRNRPAGRNAVQESFCLGGWRIGVAQAVGRAGRLDGPRFGWLEAREAPLVRRAALGSAGQILAAAWQSSARAVARPATGTVGPIGGGGPRAALVPCRPCPACGVLPVEGGCDARTGGRGGRCAARAPRGWFLRSAGSSAGPTLGSARGTGISRWLPSSTQWTTRRFIGIIRSTSA
jgi:hypothetical protein